MRRARNFSMLIAVGIGFAPFFTHAADQLSPQEFKETFKSSDIALIGYGPNEKLAIYGAFPKGCLARHEVSIDPELIADENDKSRNRLQLRITDKGGHFRKCVKEVKTTKSDVLKSNGWTDEDLSNVAISTSFREPIELSSTPHARIAIAYQDDGGKDIVTLVTSSSRSGEILVHKDQADLDAERAQAVAEARAKEARSKTKHLAALKWQVEHCGGKDLEVAKGALQDLKTLFEDENGITKYAELQEKNLNLAQFRNLQCELLGQSLDGKACAGIAKVAVADVPGKVEELLQWANQNNVSQETLLQLANATKNRVIADGGEKPDFNTASQVLAQFKEGVAFTGETKKAFAGLKQDLANDRFAYSVKDGTLNNPYAAQTYMKTLQDNMRYASNSGCMGGGYGNMGFGRRTSAPSSDFCGSVMRRVQDTQEIWNASQMQNQQIMRDMQMQQAYMVREQQRQYMMQQQQYMQMSNPIYGGGYDMYSGGGRSFGLYDPYSGGAGGSSWNPGYRNWSGI